MISVSLIELTLRYDQGSNPVTIFSDLTLDIEPAAVTAVTGPSWPNRVPFEPAGDRQRVVRTAHRIRLPRLPTCQLPNCGREHRPGRRDGGQRFVRARCRCDSVRPRSCFASRSASRLALRWRTATCSAWASDRRRSASNRCR